MKDHEQDQLAAVIQWIAGELAAGREQEEITRELQADGLTYEQAMMFVDRVATEMPPVPQEPARAVGNIRGAAAGIVLMLVAFGAVNGVLYLGQGLMKRGEVAEAKALEAQLDEIDSELSSISQWLDEMERESDAIDDLGDRLDEPAAHYPDQESYGRDLARYNELVDGWNTQALPHIEVSLARYDQLVGEFNSLVPEYNAVARSAYARWWLLPIPAPRGRRGVGR